MNAGRLILAVVLSTMSPSLAAAGDVSSLERAFENVIERLNAHDQEGFADVWHPRAVLIVYDYLFPVDRSEAGDEVWSQIFKEFFGSTKITMTPVDVDFRVEGNTGLVWGMMQVIVETSQGSADVRSLRLSATFVDVGGRWKLLSWHSSLPPEGRRAE